MRNTITFRLLVTLLFVFAAAAFLPLQGTAFAAESNAPGGTVQTNDAATFTDALGDGNVSAAKAGQKAPEEAGLRSAACALRSAACAL